LIDKSTPHGRVPGRPQTRERARGGSHEQRRQTEPGFLERESGASSTAPPPAAPKAASRAPTRWSRATTSRRSPKKFYGDANKWKKLFEANKDTIKNPDLIKIGQVLRVPE